MDGLKPDVRRPNADFARCTNCHKEHRGPPGSAAVHSAVPRKWIPQARSRAVNALCQGRLCRVQLDDTADCNAALQHLVRPIASRRKCQGAFAATSGMAPALLCQRTSSHAAVMIFRLVLVSFLATSFGVLPAAEVPIPAATNILHTLHPQHPRLLAREADWQMLAAGLKENQQLQQWKGALDRRATALLDAAPSNYEIPDGKRLLATSRRVLERVQLLGLLWRLDRDRRWADRAWVELEAAARFKDWNPSHFLDTAEMTHAFALGYDWLHDAWTPEQRDTLRRAMVDKGMLPAMKVYEKQDWWARSRHNWNQVCNGGIGMGAMALAEVEPDLCGRLLDSGLNSIQLAMEEFAPDGACIEGPGYWDYATIYNVVLLAALESALGTDFGLSGFKGFDQTGWFPIYMNGPAGKTFNYADSGEGSVKGPQLFWLASKFNEPALAAFQQKTATPEPLDLLWYRPALASRERLSPPLARWFRGSEAVTMRGSWSDPNTTCVGFKAGRNNANHGQLDIGDFVLDALGQRWAMDFGRDDYNLPGYFGRQRWDYYRLRAEGHNTLVINPGAGPDQVLSSTPITRLVSNADRAFAIGNLTAAYGEAAKRVERGVCLLGGRNVLVQDELEWNEAEAGKPLDVWWFMHTEAAIRGLKGDGNRATLERGAARLEARILEPAGARFISLPAEPLPGSPKPAKQAKNDRYRKLTIHLPEVRTLRLVVLLTPLTGDEEAARSLPEVLPLAEW